ncbi:uncharacterized protein G2W53_039470 [Senna tora]|uniref:Uncharacterized protein n=1 Tax=Senna tora TaxID=362788 RepID=A0A834SNP4_9FABA|nr:uncharacterized protein G2W53_039470 [Senna tora]
MGDVLKDPKVLYQFLPTLNWR